MDDHLGLGLRDGPRDGVGVERVGNDRPRAEGADDVHLLVLARHADDLVAARDELGH